jgi:hypothetical protein
MPSLTRFVRFGPAAGQLVGWALVAAVNAAMIALTLRLPRSGLGVRALHHVYDAAELLALGVISAALVVAWQRFVKTETRWRAEGAMFAVGVALGAWMLAGDFRGFAGNLVGDRLAGIVIVCAIAGAAALVPASAWLGRRLARGKLRFIGVAVAVGIAVANHRVVAHDYPGVHFFAVWWAAILAGCALSDFTLPAEPRSLRWLVAAAFVSCWSLFIPPSNAVRLELFRTSGSVVAPWLARIESGVSRSSNVAFSPESARWFKSRSGLPEIPATPPPLFGKNGIVLFLVIDAGRADLADPKHDAQLPNLARLRKSCVEFTNARTPAPGTTLAVTSIFTGLYPAQIRWADQRGRQYPHLDKSVRFPEILQKHGVVTLNLQGLPGLAKSWGILHGFDEEKVLPSRPGHFAGAPQMIPALIERLKRAEDRPIFSYQHYDDAHAPYDLAGKKETPFLSYLAEVAVVDQELGRLLDFLDAAGLSERTSIIVTADHGEAFGEHGKQFHATTLYDELLRVPLYVKAPGVTPRREDELVTLMDIAPTILDGFGIPTPGSFMGQSLVPLLRGERNVLGRPIVAESDRGHRAMVFSDGIKLIADDKLHTLELFDLKKDPGEIENLADSRSDLASQRRAILDAFFDAHRLRR